MNTHTTADGVGATDDITLHTDTTRFQLDLLVAIGRLTTTDDENQDLPIGLDVMHYLQRAYDEPINHGRLYTNLADLEDDGRIKRFEKDKRSQYIQLTARGKQDLRTLQTWVCYSDDNDDGGV